MSKGDIRFMRILVFFDIPVTQAQGKVQYRNFRKFLIKDGYDMVQFSVYSRLCGGQEGVDKHIARLNRNLPCEGSVRVMQLTNKQYSNMKVLVGELKAFEKNLSQKGVDVL